MAGDQKPIVKIAPSSPKYRVGKVIEKRSGFSFPRSLEENYILVLTGERPFKVGFIQIKIYALGIYVHEDDLKNVLTIKDKSGKSLEDLDGRGIMKWMYDKARGMRVKFRMVWCRSVSHSQICSNMSGDVWENFPKSFSKAQKNVEIGKVEQLFPKGGCKSESVMVIDVKDLKHCAGYYNGVYVGAMDSAAMVSALAHCFLIEEKYLNGSVESCERIFGKDIYPQVISRLREDSKNAPQLSISASSLKTASFQTKMQSPTAAPKMNLSGVLMKTPPPNKSIPTMYSVNKMYKNGTYLESEAKKKIARSFEDAKTGAVYVLLGVGVRYKKIGFMNFKVYCCSMYVDENAICKVLDEEKMISVSSGKLSFEELRKQDNLHKWVLAKSRLPLKFRMLFLRSLDAKTIRTAFGDELVHRVALERKSDREAEVKKMNPLVPENGVKEGDILEITLLDSSCEGSLNGVFTGKSDSKHLSSALPKLLLEKNFLSNMTQSLNTLSLDKSDFTVVDLKKTELSNSEKRASSIIKTAAKRTSGASSRGSGKLMPVINTEKLRCQNEEVLRNLILKRIFDKITERELPNVVIRDKSNILLSLETLMGFGVCYKKIGFMNFQVYLCSIYIPKKPLMDVLLKEFYTGKDGEAVRTGPIPLAWKWLATHQKLPKTFRFLFLRNLTKEQILNTFVDSMQHVVSPSELKKFITYLPQTSAQEGDLLEVKMNYTHMNSVSISFRNRETHLKPISSHTMMSAWHNMLFHEGGKMALLEGLHASCQRLFNEVFVEVPTSPITHLKTSDIYDMKARELFKSKVNALRDVIKNGGDSVDDVVDDVVVQPIKRQSSMSYDDASEILDTSDILDVIPQSAHLMPGGIVGGNDVVDTTSRWVEVKGVPEITSVKELRFGGDLLKYHVKGGFLRDAVGKNWSQRNFLLENGVLMNLKGKDMKSSLDMRKVSLLIEEPDLKYVKNRPLYVFQILMNNTAVYRLGSLDLEKARQWVLNITTICLFLRKQRNAIGGGLKKEATEEPLERCEGQEDLSGLYGKSPLHLQDDVFLGEVLSRKDYEFLDGSNCVSLLKLLGVLFLFSYLGIFLLTWMEVSGGNKLGVVEKETGQELISKTVITRAPAIGIFNWPYSDHEFKTFDYRKGL